MIPIRTFLPFLLIGHVLLGQLSREEKNSFAFLDDTIAVSVDKDERLLFSQRLKLINARNTIKIGMQDAVTDQVKRFLGFRWLPRTMGLAEFYFYMFEKKLEKYGLPEELKYLSVIESNLQPRAKSNVGALGLWQFLPRTGKSYGLYSDASVSLFYDPVASTDAACRHLKYLYKKFGDWELALAAYNCGEGRLERTMKKTGTNDYWQLREHLPSETRNYVPSFLAVQYIFNFYSDHQIVPQRLNIEYSKVRIIKAKNNLSLSNLATGQREKQILIFLNPHILTDRISKGTVFYSYNGPKKNGR